MFGDVLVIQPAFLFSSTSLNTSDVAIQELLSQDAVHDSEYLLGVGLCLVAAATISAANIVQVKITGEEDDGSIEKVDRDHLMISSGVWNMILSVSSLPLLPNTLLTSPSSMSPVTVAMLLVSATITLLAVWMMVTAVSLTQHPTLVSMLRTTEIVLSLVTESIYWGHLPNYLSAMGSLMVRH